jgi:hypothetical protein
MKVKDLIVFLQAADPELEVCSYSYDSEWSEGSFAPMTPPIRQTVDVFDHHVETGRNSVRSVTRKEDWLCFYAEGDESAPDTSARLYGRAKNDQD